MALTRAAIISSRSQRLFLGNLGHFNPITRLAMHPPKSLPGLFKHSTLAPTVDSSTSQMGKLLENMTHTMEKYPGSRSLAHQDIIQAVKKYAGPEPTAPQDRMIGSAAQLAEAKCTDPDNIASSQKGTFLYYQIKEQDCPEGWSNAPEDLDMAFYHSLTLWFGILAPIPLLNNEEDYLIASHGNIYSWNPDEDDMRKLLQPSTLGDLLDLMNTKEHSEKYRDTFWKNPATKWETIKDREEMHLPEHEWLPGSEAAFLLKVVPR